MFPGPRPRPDTHNVSEKPKNTTESYALCCLLSRYQWDRDGIGRGASRQRGGRSGEVGTLPFLQAGNGGDGHQQDSLRCKHSAA